MYENLTQEAINVALKSDWKEAIKVNLKILKINPKDVDALNRLSRSYYELGDLTKAKKTSINVLKIDPNNSIATKSIKKYKQGLLTRNNKQNLDPTVFIEETGKTKLTNLINVGSTHICACLCSGDEVFLMTHTHKVTLNNSEGKYIGKLPDDLSAKLRKFVKGGNIYKAYIKSVEGKNIKILIKEISRSKEFGNVQSFPRISSEPSGEDFTNSDF